MMRASSAYTSFWLIAMLAVLQLSLCVVLVESFLPQLLVHCSNRRPTKISSIQKQLEAESSNMSGRGFAVVAEQQVPKPIVDATTTATAIGSGQGERLRSMLEIKTQLLDLLPRMMGTPDEFRMVETLVNRLESMYTPPQTLDFLNFAMGGSWQLLFSTQLTTSSRRTPAGTLRLTELVQSVQPNKLKGSVVNTAQWDFSSMGNGSFDCSGTFSVVCNYSMNQGGARMVMTLDEHKLELKRGSKVPADVPALVGMLHRSMPMELFDPNHHAIDTTYLDENVRIVRMTGPTLEGVRDIFIRQGSMEIHPVKTTL